MMQFWEKLSPLMKSLAVVVVLVVIALVVRSLQEDVVEEQSVTTESAPAAVEQAETAPLPDPKPEAPETTATETVEETPKEAGQAETAEAIEPKPIDDQVADESKPAPVQPGFDVVRIAPDGNSLVAGVAEPGSTVVVQVGGVETARVTADGQGKFVAMFDLPPSEVPRAVTLLVTGKDGQQIASGDTVFVQPQQIVAAEPAVVAQADTGTEVEQPEQVAESTDETESAQPATEPAPEPEKQSPTVVVANQDGVKVLQSAVDQNPALQSAVVIEVITYTDNGDVTFAGRAAAGQFVRLYLNNAAIGGVRVDDAGAWSGTFDNIAPGVYTLRADQIDDAGKVTSRFETPFQRVERETVLAMLSEQAEPQSAGEGAIESPAEAAAPAEGDKRPEATEEPSQIAASSDTASSPAQDDTQTTEAARPSPATADEATVAVKPAEENGQAEAPATTSAPQQIAAQGPVTVTVQPGNTLWAIAEANYGDGLQYVDVFQVNKDKIRDPDLIYPGQIFTVPPKE